jgi:hypothetical protein
MTEDYEKWRTIDLTNEGNILDKTNKILELIKMGYQIKLHNYLNKKNNDRFINYVLRAKLGEIGSHYFVVVPHFSNQIGKNGHAVSDDYLILDKEAYGRKKPTLSSFSKEEFG